MEQTLESLAPEVAARLVDAEQSESARNEARRIVSNRTGASQLTDGGFLGYVALIVQISAVVLEVHKIYAGRSKGEQVAATLRKVVDVSEDATLSSDPRLKRAVEVALDVVNESATSGT